LRSSMLGATYKTGQRIPESGIYVVAHREHRLPHEVTLVEGETFPRCSKCGNLVEFVLDQAVPFQPGVSSQVVRVYALPDLDDDQRPNPLQLGIPHSGR
jgi:hypothetical protein